MHFIFSVIFLESRSVHMTAEKLDLKLLETLTNAFGPSAFELEVQKIVKEYGTPFAEEILTDRTGSLIFKHGSGGPKIMLSGHVDEIGYIVSSITKTGFLKIAGIGGVFPGNQVAQEIIIRPFSEGPKIIGIIQRKPPFGPNKKDPPKLGDFFVDIGCNNAEEVKALGILVGDPAVPRAQFRTMLRKRIQKNDKSKNEDTKEEIESHLAVAKAFDDRIGVFVTLEVLRRISEQSINHPNTLYFTSSTQEEVGLRGIKTAAHLIQPDIGFSLDVNVSGDLPGMQGFDQKMGKGVVISAFDRSMIPNPRFRKFVIGVAEEKNIPWQMGFLPFGGTDAGAMHLTGIGAPSLFIGIATRYVHSHHSLLDLQDVEDTIQFLIEVIKKLDTDTVSKFTQI